MILPIINESSSSSSSSLPTQTHKYNNFSYQQPPTHQSSLFSQQQQQQQQWQYNQSNTRESDLVKSPNMMIRYNQNFYSNSYNNNYHPINSEDINSVFDELDDKINHLRGYL